MTRRNSSYFHYSQPPHSKRFRSNMDNKYETVTYVLSSWRGILENIKWGKLYNSKSHLGVVVWCETEKMKNLWRERNREKWIKERQTEGTARSGGLSNVLVEITDFVLHAVKKNERMKERKLCFDLDTRHTRENATNLFLRLQFCKSQQRKWTMHGLGAKKWRRSFFFCFCKPKKVSLFCVWQKWTISYLFVQILHCDTLKIVKKGLMSIFFGSKATNIGNTKEGKMDCRVKQNKTKRTFLHCHSKKIHQNMKWNETCSVGGWTPTDEKIIHFIFYGSFPTRENVINKVFCWLTNICDSTRI